MKLPGSGFPELADYLKSAVLVDARDADVEEEPPFLMSWGADLTPLKISLGRVGQVTPLILWPDQGRIKLLCGYRRRQAMRELGRGGFKAWCLQEGTGAKAALSLALEENLGHRFFNDAEKALVVKWLSHHWSPRDITTKHLPGLGIPPRDTFFHRYLALANLGPAGLEALAKGQLDPETGEFLAGLDGADQTALLSLLTALSPNTNQRRQIIIWLEEISRRQDRTIAGLLEHQDIQSVLAADKLNRSQKEKQVRAILRAWRYPTLTRMEQDRAAYVKALNLPANVRLKLPENFEGLTFSVEITFTRLADLRAALASLTLASDGPDLAGLIDLG